MFSGEQKAKLTQMVNEGIQVLTEVEDLTAGLNDTIKAIAEELEKAAKSSGRKGQLARWQINMRRGKKK